MTEHDIEVDLKLSTIARWLKWIASFAGTSIAVLGAAGGLLWHVHSIVQADTTRDAVLEKRVTQLEEGRREVRELRGDLRAFRDQLADVRVVVAGQSCPPAQPVGAWR